MTFGYLHFEGGVWQGINYGSLDRNHIVFWNNSASFELK
jgi:hypothetical protein